MSVTTNSYGFSLGSRGHYFSHILLLASLFFGCMGIFQSAYAADGELVTRNFSGSVNLYSSTSSADGKKMAAVADQGYIHTSTDYGVTWTQQTSAGSRNWRAITSSADGVKLVALDEYWDGSRVFTSADSGVTWIERPMNQGTPLWTFIVSSADGTKLAAVSANDTSYGPDYIYTSTDSGVTWTKRTSAGRRNWSSIASSSDGTKLVATSRGASGLYIYTSTDSGVTWTQRTSAGARHWSSIASSSDGTKLAAVAQYDSNYEPDYIYTSTDSGVTWTQQTGSGVAGWDQIASSAGGTHLVAGTDDYIYTSADSGVTWTQYATDVSMNINSLTSSADGNRLIVANNAHLYTFSVASPQLTISILSPLSGSAVSSWQPFISWGTAVTGTCQYKWDDGTWENTVCALNGSDIPELSAVGSHTLSVRATDSLNTTSTASSSFIFQVPLSIISPASSTTINAWNPSIDWNAKNLPLNTLACSYSYDNFVTSFGADCSLGGTDTPSPTWTEESTPTLSAKVVYTQGAETSETTAQAIFTISPWEEKASADIQAWTSLASSANGTKLAATGFNGFIYTSADSGNTWIQRTNTATQWYAIASSADGIKLVAVERNNSIYTSSDSGVTWTERLPKNYTNTTNEWRSVTSSADGTKLAVAGTYDLSDGYIYTSTDSGVTWTKRTSAGSRKWMAIASSSDGTKLVAGACGNNCQQDSTGYYIYTSTDSGVTWTQQTNSGLHRWIGIASSADGTKLAATERNGYIYTSTDSGATWTEQANSGVRLWSSVTSSADGTKLAATVGYNGTNGYIYTSTDSGVTWVQSTSAGAQQWPAIASSSDGNKIVALANNGHPWVFGSFHPDNKVNILDPLTTQTITTWMPIVSTSISTNCEYSWDNITWIPIDCAVSGSDIPTPTAAGSYTLYVRGAKDSADPVVSQSVFTADIPLVPILVNPTATSITQTTVTLGASVETPGNPNTLSARGICYGMAASPSLTDGVSICEEKGQTTSGVFTLPVTGLFAKNVYHYRGYATNATGTGYSPDATFTTTPLTSLLTANPNGATITWTTDTALSSIVDYGLTASYDNSTPEANISPRVTSHTVVLTGLVACSTYHYRVRSLDAGGNVSSSNNNTFTTTGCTGTAPVLDQDQGSIIPDTGGTLDLIADDTTGITLDVPVGATEDSETPVTYQIKALSQTDVFTSSGTPTGMLTAGDYAFDLKALTDIGTALTSFLEPLEITIHYQNSDLTGIREGTLRIYRHDGSTWTPLTNCSINTEANTITCTTTHFSVFSLFGQASGGGGGGSVSTPVVKQLPTINTQKPDALSTVTARQAALSAFLEKTLTENTRTGFATRLETVLLSLAVQGAPILREYTCQKLYSDTFGSLVPSYTCQVAEKAQAAKIISATNKEFKPLKPVSRIEAYTIMMKSTCVMPETTDTNWQSVVIRKAMELGFTVRTLDTFEPDRALTITEMYTVVQRLNEYGKSHTTCTP